MIVELEETVIKLKQAITDTDKSISHLKVEYERLRDISNHLKTELRTLKKGNYELS